MLDLALCPKKIFLLICRLLSFDLSGADADERSLLWKSEHTVTAECGGDVTAVLPIDVEQKYMNSKLM